MPVKKKEVADKKKVVAQKETKVATKNKTTATTKEVAKKPVSKPAPAKKVATKAVEKSVTKSKPTANVVKKSTEKPIANSVATKKPLSKSTKVETKKMENKKPSVKPQAKDAKKVETKHIEVKNTSAKPKSPAVTPKKAVEVKSKVVDKKVEVKKVITPKKEIIKEVAKKTIVEIKPTPKDTIKKVAPKKPTITVEEEIPHRILKPTVKYPDADLDMFKERISIVRHEAIEELRMLRERLEDLTNYDFAEESMIYSMHMAEQGSEAFEKEKTYAQIQRINEYIKKLDDALARIKDKTYGICRVCGCLIAKERLLAVPITTLSASYKIQKRCPEDGIDRIEPLRRD